MLSFLSLSNLCFYFSRVIFQTAIHGFVTFCLNYCSSFFAGLPASTLCFIQLVQNYVASFLYHSCKFTHINFRLRDFGNFLLNFALLSKLSLCIKFFIAFLLIMSPQPRHIFSSPLSHLFL